MNSWLNLAMNKNIVWRSIKVGLVVGTVLVAINYTDRIIATTLQPFDYIKIILTYMVPYCVSTYSSVGAILEGDG